MKIDAYLSGVIDKYVKQQSKTAKAEKTEAKASQASTTKPSSELDKVEISPQAKLLAQLKEDEQAKAQRIAQIKAQIENGSYKPDLDAIAKSIVKEWKGE
ncbi:flagellar biosynthesis anti-sigma factor FlgM [Hippea sp. KM1]|uniref:flagellar biosynthesis anti-sigma factor FlgM n=1 Tax=Hippea sp. KM1 TaxID=944481 RepID=UPI00046D2129|nr:flagellar biosynthesis anti-sigma factor FlgM [Hippea sp. KM1]